MFEFNKVLKYFMIFFGAFVVITSFSGCVTLPQTENPNDPHYCDNYKKGVDIQKDAICGDKVTITAVSTQNSFSGEPKNTEKSEGKAGASGVNEMYFDDTRINYFKIVQKGVFGIDRNPKKQTKYPYAPKTPTDPVSTKIIDSIFMGYDETDVYLKVQMASGKNLEDLWTEYWGEWAQAQWGGQFGEFDIGFGRGDDLRNVSGMVVFKCNAENRDCVLAADNDARYRKSDSPPYALAEIYSSEGGVIHIRARNTAKQLAPDGKIVIGSALWTEVPYGEALGLK